MLFSYMKKYRSMILCSIFFFYFGCGVTLSLLKMECTDDKTKKYIDNSAFNLHSNVEYAVLILSAADNVAKRDTIRTTWMRLASNIVTENGERIYRWHDSYNRNFVPPKFIRFYFVIGTKWMASEKIIQLSTEFAKNQDLLLLDEAVEGYKDLSEKMLKSLEWFSENLKSLKYLIKCDDDSFLRIDIIIRDLEAFAPTMSAPELSEYVTYKESLPSPKALYWGYFIGRARVYQSGKWQEQKWFLCDNYLPYALGGGYVISKAIVNYIGINNDLLGLYISEDVSMGVWTAALRNINRVHDIRFDTEWTSRGCSNDMIVRHKQSTSDMFQMYKNLVHTKGLVLCTNISEIRKTYRYKWNVPPSQCCNRGSKV